ncbi:hypothetical protein [Motiliproteus sp.]|uniref:hypothetical protein n=1 Tax=Motiliproteus sp. TaxID=1898955 RepID=UPI003BAAAD19
MKLLLLEGIPGSGKTTLAEQLCDSVIAKGLNASWHREEAKDHPVHPHDGRREDKSVQGFLNQWRQFIEANAGRDQLFILEGSLFQSSVRYLLESDHEAQIADYYATCLTLLAPVSPQLIYLRPNDIASQVDWTLDHRGEDWRRKLISYLDNTAYCRRRGWKGRTGMIAFMDDYARHCDALVAQSPMPIQIIRFEPGEFGSHREQSIAFVSLSQPS